MPNPLAGANKKMWLIGGGVAVIVGGYVMLKKKNQGASGSASGAYAYGYGAYGYGAMTSVPLAYGYGSQGYGYYGYGGAYGGMGGYGSPAPPSVPAQVATTNAGWAQAAESYLTSQGYASMTVAAALGKYLTGQTVNSSDQAIIEAAIAFEGYPPTAGANNYPPNIHTAGQGSQGSGSQIMCPKGHHRVKKHGKWICVKDAKPRGKHS